MNNHNISRQKNTMKQLVGKSGRGKSLIDLFIYGLRSLKSKIRQDLYRGGKAIGNQMSESTIHNYN